MCVFVLVFYVWVHLQNDQHEASCWNLCVWQIQEAVTGQLAHGEASSVQVATGGSVKCPGGSPRSLHAHTHAHSRARHPPTHTAFQKRVCVSWRDCGVVTLLMGPYGHKTNTNCSSSRPVIRSWRCWSHSDRETSRREDARGCGLNSQGGRSIASSLSCIWVILQTDVRYGATWSLDCYHVFLVYFLVQ